MMDILDDVLSTLNLKGSLYFRTDFSNKWALKVPQHNQAARFHLVTQGRTYVTVANEKPVELSTGDLILIPKGKSHIISEGPANNAPSLETILNESGYKGDGVLVIGSGSHFAATQMVCGHFNFRAGAEHPLLRSLPDYILTSSSDRAKHPLLDEAVNLISRRVFTESLGSTAAVTRLSEIVFIELIRSGISKDPKLSCIVEAFRDGKIARSLQLIHSNPSDSWTVASLATTVAMSRSRFAERFRSLIGMSPMAYLSEWRLQKALSLLEDSRISVQQVASKTGYQSSSAFSRAFQGKFGFAPKDYRNRLAS
jgi:AraC family transcriptional regulator, activator of mtrCDE